MMTNKVALESGWGNVTLDVYRKCLAFYNASALNISEYTDAFDMWFLLKVTSPYAFFYLNYSGTLDCE